MSPRHSVQPTVDSSEQRTAFADAGFLGAVVLLSAAPYIAGLGWYSDDWAILANLQAAHGSLRAMWELLMGMGVATRPVQGILLIGLYLLFGIEPLGYHVTNTAILAAAAVLFYLSLRRLAVPRPLALAAPLVFALLPHYSTDRFWIAACQANASVLLYFLSLYADLRFLGGRGRALWAWKAVGTLALIGSVLAYEVTGALFLVNILIAYAAGLGRLPVSPGKRMASIGIAINVLALALSVAFKLVTTERAGMSDGLRFRVLRIFTEGAPVHFGEYGLELPARLLTALRYHADARIVLVGVLIGVMSWLYLTRAWRGDAGPLRHGVTWLAVIGVGIVLFFAGYGVSVTTWEIGFHTTGANNRTAIGAAIGTAVVFTGVAGLASTLLRGRLQRSLFALLIALLAAANVLVTAAVGSLWVAAAERQEEVIEAVRRAFPTLADGTNLLLDGLCPYVGPAPVFTTDWDVEGMLEIKYAQRSLNGDIIKPNTEVMADGIRTTLFDDWVRLYPYGDRLRALHLGVGATAVFTREAEAIAWFRDISLPGRASCPPYTDGDGVDVF